MKRSYVVFCQKNDILQLNKTGWNDDVVYYLFHYVITEACIQSRSTKYQRQVTFALRYSLDYTTQMTIDHSEMGTVHTGRDIGNVD